MDNEIKQHLDSAGFKFIDIDENGIEKKMTLSEMVESLIENNKKLDNLLYQKSKEIEQLKTIINNAIKYIKKNTHNIYADGYRDRETGKLLSIEKTPIVNRIFSENPQKLLEILNDRQQ